MLYTPRFNGCMNARLGNGNTGRENTNLATVSQPLTYTINHRTNRLPDFSIFPPIVMGKGSIKIDTNPAIVRHATSSGRGKTKTATADTR